MNNMSFNSMTSSCYPSTANVSGVYPYASGGTVYPSSAVSVTSGGWVGAGTGGTGWTQVFPSQTAVWPEVKKDKDPIERLMEFMIKEKEERMAREEADREEIRRRQEKLDAQIRRQAELMQKAGGGDPFSDEFSNPSWFETWSDPKHRVPDINNPMKNAPDEKVRMGNEIERLTMMLEREREINAKHQTEDKQYNRESDQRLVEMAMHAQESDRQMKLESEKIAFDRHRMDLQASQANQIRDHKYKLLTSIWSGITAVVVVVIVLGAFAFSVITAKEYDLKTLKLNKGVETSQSK